MKQSLKARPAFTLLELLLSLALIVVATALIGSLMSLYARSFATKGDQIKQKQLARSLLSMIADDIRAVVLAQEYDESVLQAMMGASAMGASASSATGGGTPAGTSSGTGASTGSVTGSTTAGTGSAASEEASEQIILPPGIYGSRFQLMVDVSRIPRTNEYNMNAVMPGGLADVPGDVKSVTYLMQSANPLGVQDSMLQVSSTASTLASNGGLIRRSLDRLVLRYAEQNAMANQLMTSGDLVAPEVVALEFAYYDGTQWVYDWDSSVQGLPWLIQINMALQSPAGAELNPLNGAITLSSLTLEDQQAYGIEVFELTVAIPGAQLQAIPSSQSGSGMESMGL